ncbi:mannosyltransferase PIG-V [Archangium gephyra]|uniref:Mannosyltransferase PIG-V n=1 Tax=Archangium gephyra TaxID=48 RepID=A0AAC8TET5_9BACT|nr:mannosyltransferase family protein [Archangium gephyra]AKJ01876.1 membrane protein [Archangium gephyra]REG34685.1 mannosyltransferase PIG-V [Archangium gephyra]
MSRSASRTLALVILAAVLACAVSGGLAAWRFHHKNPQAPVVRLDEYVVMGWVGWDSSWYMRIAEEGYSFTPGEQSSVAFFPLYPLAIRAVEALGPDVYQAGVLVTLLCGPLAILLFLRWARFRAEEPLAFQASLLLALYPFTFFLYGVMYSDALFLLLVVGAFLLLEKGHLGLAVLLGAVATAARPVAPAVVLGLLARRLEWKRERGERWTVLDFLPVLSALGFLLYMLYLDKQFGAPFAFAEAQAGWGQEPGWRSVLKLSWFKTVFFSHANAETVSRLCLHALLTLGALVLVGPTFRKLGWGYGVYCAVLVGIPAVTTKDFMGMGRYLISAFPLFLTLALLLRDHPRVRQGILAVGAVSLVLLSAAFGLDHYIS